MAEIYEGMGGTVLYETRGRELVQNPQTKEVLGVRAEKADGSSIFIKARKGVVLACGGYEASPELTQEYIRACMDIAVTGSPFNRGDGVLMARPPAHGSITWTASNGRVTALASNPTAR